MKTKPPQPILCATDFSGLAKRATDFAAVLAQRMQTRLILAHGIDERGEFLPQHWPGLAAADRPRLAAEAERLRVSGAVVEEFLLGPVPDEGVAACAKETDAQLIVAACSGQGAVYRWLFGSISEHIAETAEAPTLVVHDASALESWLRDDRPLKILVGADFTPVSEAALRWVADFTRIAPCEVTVAYVDQEAGLRGEEAMHLPADLPRAPEMHQMLTHDLRIRAEAILGPAKVRARVMAADDRVDLHLLDLAEITETDLIVVGAHQWHGLNRLRHPSVSRRVLHEAKTNVVCVPAPPACTQRTEAATEATVPTP